MPTPFVTLSQFADAVGNAIYASPYTRNQWVTAEISSMSSRGGHCYLELIEKDERGQTIAKMRATIWAGQYMRIRQKFEYATGRPFAVGLKVMLFGSATMHKQYGLALNVTDIDPSYTLGDAERLRREILAQLQREGVLNNQQGLQMPSVPQRIAVISSPTAAGYGDFMNQLQGNTYGYQFYTCLFEATMQGVNTAKSVSDALCRIEQSIDLWDCVVIIRGGGATSDLDGFDNLELARNVATFVLPVMVGIGHERDRTVLDEIANTRVKTPTAAAEWLINRAHEADLKVSNLVSQIMQYIQQSMTGATRQLDNLQSMLQLATQKQIADQRAYVTQIGASLPVLINKRIQAASQNLNVAMQNLSNAGVRRIAEADSNLKSRSAYLKSLLPMLLTQRRQQLRSIFDLLQALSPENTLKRGYSITRVAGKAITDASAIAPGTEIVTTLSNGTIKSTTIKYGS